jgi:molybdopterin/thiamine biosynthesis adenylyltransferase
MLAGKRALVLGAGGLGGPALLGLAAAGVGRLVVLDDALVEVADLARLPLAGEGDVGAPRAAAAARRLARQFPGVAVEVLARSFAGPADLGLVRAADVLVDGAGDPAASFAASDAALQAGRPLVHGGVLRTTAQLLTVRPGETGCLRCLFEAPPPPGASPGCAEAGVLGPLAGVAGALLGDEAVRLLCGERGSYAGLLVTWEARRARVRTVPVPRRPGCAACAAAAPEVAAAPDHLAAPAVAPAAAASAGGPAWR